MYIPSEDSFFLSETLKKYFSNTKIKSKTVLDIGTGTGIQAETLLEFFDKNSILCSDIDEEAVKYAKLKKFHTIKSDLFKKIKEKFDFIVFNPPYLPELKYDKEKDTTGGKLGDETILKFLRQIKNHLNKNGKVFLLLSSLTPRTRIKKELEKQNLICKKIAEKKLFFEKLEVWIIS